MNSSGLSLCHSFIACKGVLLPNADYGSGNPSGQGAEGFEGNPGEGDLAAAGGGLEGAPVRFDGDIGDAAVKADMAGLQGLAFARALAGVDHARDDAARL